MKRHDFDPISLVAGVLFTGLGIASLTGSVRYADMDLSWVWPLTIAALGLALLLGSAGRESSPETADRLPSEAPTSDEEPIEPESDAPPRDDNA
jgi:hypothetical protein